MQWPGGRILQRHELDAFLAQAVSNQLYEPDQLQELKVPPPLVPSSRVLLLQEERLTLVFLDLSGGEGGHPRCAALFPLYGRRRHSIVHQ